MSEIEEEKEGLGASPADAADRATDASHGAAEEASPPSRSVSTGARFTPGPWQVRVLHDTQHYGAFQLVTLAKRQRAHMRDDAEGGGKAEFEASLALIAAAPLLYEALTLAVPIIEAEREVMISSHMNLSGPDIGKITGEEAEIVERMDAALNAARAALSAALGQGAR